MPVSQETFNVYFSCFSHHPVRYKDVEYRTAEHAYHAQRYTDPAIIDEIQSAPTARDAWAVSQRHKEQQVPHFNEIKREVMKDILKHKLEQHADVRQVLIDTRDEKIIKYEPKDAYWGTGPDGAGRNELGKLWMEIREEQV